MTSQLALPLARRTDPVTSRAAAARATSLRVRHISLIWASLCDAGPGTFEEVAQRIGLTPLQVARRFAEMRERGLIERTDTKRATASGREAFVHSATERR